MMNKNKKYVSTLTDIELINCHSAVLKELKNRGIIRTKNVIGELGEKIAVEHFNTSIGLSKLKLTPTSTKHVDAICGKGNSYAIKTITGRTTGVFYGLPDLGSTKKPKKIFDYLLVLKLDENYEVQKIIEIDWKIFLKSKKWHSRMKAWNITVTKELITRSIVRFEKSK